MDQPKVESPSKCYGCGIYECRKTAYRRSSGSYVIAYTTRRIKQGQCRCDKCENHASAVEDWLNEDPNLAPEKEGTYRAAFIGSTDYWGESDYELEFVEVRDEQQKPQ